MNIDRPGYKFASVVFVNSALWTYRMDQVSPGSKIIYDVPSRLAEKLINGSVDAALIPVADLFANPSLKMIGNIGLSSNGDVTSVLLKCNRPLQDIRNVMLDKSSHTSNRLVEILLKRHFHVDVKMGVSEGVAQPDAEVVIGDRALLSEPAPFGDYDLAGEWKAMTGLPFVFAVWAARKECQNAEAMTQVLEASLDRGLLSVAEVSQKEAQKIGMPLEQCRDYIENVISYKLGRKELKSMRLFKEMIDDKPKTKEPQAKLIN